MAPKPFPSSGRGQARPQPEGKTRQSQVVTTFGPGSMIDLVHDAVLMGGLDFWRFDTRRGGGVAIHEPRLRDALAEQLQKIGRTLRMENAFLEPPAGDERDPTQACGILVMEFPRWFVCQNPKCRGLVRSDHLERSRGKYVHTCNRSETECVPVRFVAACRNGHLDEFPWLYFVHEAQSKPRCGAPQMQLHEGSSGDFAEVEVSCSSCGARRRLIDASVEQANPKCTGERPWLGRDAAEPCTERLRLLVRNASNSYFTQVQSALSIPEKGLDLRNAVQSVWHIVKVATAATLPAFRTIGEVKAALADYADDEVLDAIEAINANRAPTREPLRTAEFKQLIAAKPAAPGDLPESKAQFFARAIEPAGMPKQIARVILAHKLREVRAQIGFTRIEGASANLQGEYEVQSAPLGLLTDWLPAVEVRGEGLFLQLSEKEVRDWERKGEVVARAKSLASGYTAWAKANRVTLPFPGARFYLLHSLAHLLVSAVSLECGYAASAIRERIYCAGAGEATPMAAILLSTGAPGTEGTLGGLVDQGRNLRSHLRRAFDLGTLCSNDPVCASHRPDRDPTERYLEGAACHGCLFIAECSCERFNHQLDRALVVPTLGNEYVAFFGERP